MAEATTLKASHQWPGGKGDVRDEMVQIIAKEVAAANVDLKIVVYPGKSLFKPKEQWSAMVKGQLDISAFPLDYADPDVEEKLGQAQFRPAGRPRGGWSPPTSSPASKLSP